MRLVVARCEVSYSGRLNAFLSEPTRLPGLKDDPSALVHADGYKPLECGFKLPALGLPTQNARTEAERARSGMALPRAT